MRFRVSEVLMETYNVKNIEDAVLYVGDDPLGLKDLSVDELLTLKMGIAYAVEKLEFWIDYLEKGVEL